MRDSVLRADCQRVLFSPDLQTRDILEIADIPSELKTVRINIQRNQGFEIVARLITPFAAFAGCALQPVFSAYDDSLSFRDHSTADVEIVWLDYSRYLKESSPERIAEFVRARVSALRSLTDSPILLNSCESSEAWSVRLNEQLDALARDQPGVHVCDLSRCLAGAGETVIDSRSEKITGTKFGSRAMAQIARSFGLQWIPAAVFPRVKAIALDLDETLYCGVLGEDGMDVHLTAGHRVLHEKLVELHRGGMFLILVSRNARSDVADLFRTRTDFPLRLEHFSHLGVNWSAKAEAIREAAAHLRIGQDSVLLVDDNPGEIISVVSTLPEIRTLHAFSDGAQTARALDLFPGIFTWRSSKTDLLRATDLGTSTERQRLAKQYDDPVEYLASLKVSVSFQPSDRSQIDRLAEVSNKTNQFNLALNRLSAAQVARYMESSDRSAVAISMRDRLSDSGNIGAVFLRFTDDLLIVEELCLSCRALGRNLEDFLVLNAILLAQGERTIKRLAFDVRVGTRNEPARQWLSQLVGKSIDRLAATEQIDWRPQEVRTRLAAYPVTIANERT